MTQPKKGQIDVEIDDATAQGTYSNLAFISHSEQEFILDFMFLPPQQPKAKVRSRLILNPKHAKRFLAALSENVTRYEATFGPIVVQSNRPPDSEMYN